MIVRVLIILFSRKLFKDKAGRAAALSTSATSDVGELDEDEDDIALMRKQFALRSMNPSGVAKPVPSPPAPASHEVLPPRLRSPNVASRPVLPSPEPPSPAPPTPKPRPIPKPRPAHKVPSEESTPLLHKELPSPTSPCMYNALSLLTTTH
jgi:outer membrane biosynthesis protein TonB